MQEEIFCCRKAEGEIFLLILIRATLAYIASSLVLSIDGLCVCGVCVSGDSFIPNISYQKPLDSYEAHT